MEQVGSDERQRGRKKEKCIEASSYQENYEQEGGNVGSMQEEAEA